MIKTKEIFKQLTSGPSFLDTMSDFIIRPQRSNYDLIDLGPSVFRIGDECKIRFQRTDIDLYNMRNMNIKCSWFRPLHQEGKLPCVVYCHANCGGRYDGLEALFLLTHGFTLFCFDFCGSGMSEGEYISLGFYERQDLATVTEYLYLQPDVDGIALWGRSMGAVTSVMYASKDRNIRCVICDSPFGSLRWLVHDLVEQNGGRTAKFIPSAVINNIVERIRKRIMRRAAFDIDDLNTVKYASQCQVPGLLFHGEEDDFVSYKQSMAVRDAFQASCIHMLVPGGHNDEREEEIHNLIVGYLRLYMIEKPQAERENPAPAPDPSSAGKTPPVLRSCEVRTVVGNTSSSKKKSKSKSREKTVQGTVVSTTPPPTTTTPSLVAQEDSSSRPTLRFAERDEEAPVEQDDDTMTNDSLDMTVDVDAISMAQPISFSKVKMSGIPNEPVDGARGSQDSSYTEDQPAPSP